MTVDGCERRKGVRGRGGVAEREMKTRSVLSGVDWNVIVYVNEIHADESDYPKRLVVKVMLNGMLIVDVMVNVMAYVHVKRSNEN